MCILMMGREILSSMNEALFHALLDTLSFYILGIILGPKSTFFYQPTVAAKNADIIMIILLFFII